MPEPVTPPNSTPSTPASPAPAVPFAASAKAVAAAEEHLAGVDMAAQRAILKSLTK